MKSGSALQTTVRALCLVSSVLLTVVGLIHIFKAEPRIKWPDSKWNQSFSDDINIGSWRFQLFSFAPSVFSKNSRHTRELLWQISLSVAVRVLVFVCVSTGTTVCISSEG